MASSNSEPNSDHAGTSRKQGGTFRYRFDTVEYDEASMGLQVDGEPVNLEPRPLRLLAELLHHVNEVVTKEELFENVWDGRPTVDNVLANAITKLRRALGKIAAERIVNLPRIGYRFAGPVERIATGATPITDLGLQVGQAVPERDGFVLERPLGSSERTNVWLAQHAKTKASRVFKFANDAEQLRSLKREFTLFRVLREELGERPDIVNVIDCNFRTAPFFIECEYGGPDLLAWAADKDQLAKMSQAERLGVFLQIARAVAAAHSVGVLHKDLKPANLLVSGEPPNTVVKLTDFGSGRALDLERLQALGLTAMGLTMTVTSSSGSLSGTAMYLAPEVLAGKTPSMQGDVYALGIVLYQMLVGDLRRPLSTGWQRDIEDELLREDITAATEGQMQTRLASVAELVERLATIDSRHTELAQRKEVEERAAQSQATVRKRSARRPWLIATMAVLTLGLIASATLAWRTQQALAQTKEQVQRAEAIRSFMQDDLLGGIQIDRVGDGGLVSMRDVLQRASLRVGDRLATQPINSADVRDQIGRIYYQLTDFKDAATEYRQGLETLEPVSDSDTVQTLRATLRLHLSIALADMSQTKEAKQLLTLVESTLPPEQAGSKVFEILLLQTRLRLLQANQQFDECIGPARRIVELFDALPGDQLQSRFKSRSTLTDLLFFTGKYAEAKAISDVLLNSPYTVEKIGLVQHARAQILRGKIESALGNLDDAVADLTAGKTALISQIGANNLGVADAANELGGIYDTQGNFREAVTSIREALESVVATQGKDSVSARIVGKNLIAEELNSGHAAEALAALNESRIWFVKKVGNERAPIVQSVDFARARALNSLNRSSEAAKVLDTLDAKKLVRTEAALDWEWRLQAEKGRALIGMGQTQQGRQMIKEALPHMETSGTPEWFRAAYRKLLG